MQLIRNFLTENYGKINPAWESLLEMYDSNLHLLMQCEEEVEKHGVVNYSEKTGALVKNPLISTIKDLKSQNIKILDAIGIGPWVQHRMRAAAVDDTDDFINSLTD